MDLGARPLRERVAAVLAGAVEVDGEPVPVDVSRARPVRAEDAPRIVVFSPGMSAEPAGAAHFPVVRAVERLAVVATVPLGVGAGSGEAPDPAALDRALGDLADAVEAAIASLVLTDREVCAAYRSQGFDVEKGLSGDGQAADRPIAQVRILFRFQAVYSYAPAPGAGVDDADLSVVHIRTHTGDADDRPASTRASDLEV